MVRTIIKKLRSFDWGRMEKEKFVPLPAISFDKLCVNRFILPSQDEN